ncbi:FAD-dependent thymidylate synthase [Paratractidigestivibacter sp.]|uniref:FAD-dependent thymidylate synthase n=1 Tax=Paratractidigestivibacter sp. TaxID=2847316 RepID=UPI002ACB1394|nr:FAD-dependent thymidylate synthase [Paratractidigestivibacter sp.]
MGKLGRTGPVCRKIYNRRDKTKIIQPGIEFITPINGDAILKRLEQCGRVCYKSEDKITKDSAAKFVASIIQRGHESVLEHCSFTVKFICDRGVSHELVRHRLASYSQESSRYCDYSKGKFGGEIAVIEPRYFDRNGAELTKHMRGKELQCTRCDYSTEHDIPRNFCPNCGEMIVGG